MQDDNDRRAGQERVPFEALVAVDGDAKAGGYECEAMDVSQSGMHLRTAYLPDIGQELTLRFDAGTGEVIVKGLVVWREEQARGGEFGLEFSALDEQSLASLRELCGLDAEIAAAPEGGTGEKAQTSRGSRVRLHIEGLGSPMRARVKDAEGSAVMVGSNLDFLRVGRELELENMEHGEKRAAFIDRVDVEIDPESHIPQLVVTLKYDAKDAGKGTAMRKSVSSNADLQSADAPAEELGEQDEQHDEGPGAMDALRGKASAIASTIGPAMSSFGLRAKTAMASAIAAIKSRGQNAADDDGEDAPKVTAEAPDGGLSSSGRRGERLDDEQDEDDAEEQALRVEAADEKTKKRKLLLAGGAAMAVLVALVLTLSGGKKKPEGDLEASAAASASAEMAALAAPAVPGGFGQAQGALGRPTLPPGADAVTAAVPLFGSTPLSTTEPAALPAPVASGGPAVAVPSTALAVAEAPAADKEEKAEKDVGDATFGKGTVKNGKVVRLKMDAPIEGIKGAVAGKTLTITLPGRHNVEAASGLAKKDKRISSAKAVATSDGVDVTLTFKDNVPPFLAKTDGKTLAIELGEASAKGTAVAENDEEDEKPSKKKSKKHATAKKGEKHGKDKKKGADKKKKKHLRRLLRPSGTAKQRGVPLTGDAFLLEHHGEPTPGYATRLVAGARPCHDATFVVPAERHPHSMNEPRIIGRYVVSAEIASGGMATVHFGRVTGAAGFARLVAVKRLLPQYAKDPEFVAMFVDEARLASRIRHPNVVPTLDVVSDEGELLVVMEYVAGETLAKAMRAAGPSGPVAPSIASAIAIGLLLGLHAAHEARGEGGIPLEMIHRDVSPQNVMIGEDGAVLVLDFGIARAVGRLQTTREGQLKGKVAYMAPEQLLGERCDRRLDVYAASVVLWETITGTRLFRAETEGATLYRVLNDDVPPPSALVPGLSPALDAVVLRGLARDPAARFATAEEMARALEAAVPPASMLQLSTWIRGLVGPSLAERARRAENVEDTARSVVGVGGHAEPRPAESSQSTGAPLSTDARLAVARGQRVSRAVVVAAVAAVALVTFAGALLGLREKPSALATAASAKDAGASVEGSATPSGATGVPGAPSASGVPTAGVAASTSAGAGESTKKAPPGKRASCANPFYLDAKGIQRVRRECL
jgi:serine/threonine-protein kinase